MSNITIAIPPFPSQDLAKLVLGYLAEEQLMTAYDEFLQASPYLDALRNEFDRIFMTSLKNILAEYRAVKIYVETCKPFILRRKLFQCTNLLEIVKFLVNNVDINKLHVQEGNVDKCGHSRQSLSKSFISCDVCTSLKLPNCACSSSSQSTCQIEANSLERSVETTSLADLPGNTACNEKIAQEPEPKHYISHSITSSVQIKDDRTANLVQCSDNLSSSDGSGTTHNVISSVAEVSCATNPSLLTNVSELELRQKLQGLNDDLSLVSHNRNDDIPKPPDCNDTENMSNVIDTGILQDIAAEDGINNKVIVPDSSTSENIVLQTPTNENDNVANPKNSKRIKRHPPLLIRVSNEPKHNKSLQPNILHSLPRLAAKESTNTEEDNNSPKITILSDVKVDNDMKLPPLLKSAAAASLMQMQTLFINGTPAYKNTQAVAQAFTKDEIMAMPTIIIVPASDKNKKIVPIVTQNNMLNINCSSDTVTCKTSQTLEPLVIDVSPAEATSSQINNTIIDNGVKNTDKQINDGGLIQTVEVMSVSHASLPKDNILAGLKSSTPQVLPPTRKSSSTPRRSSHVRVLDFTTPRRILHETLNEQEVKQCFPPSEDITLSKEIISPPVNNNSNKDVVPKVSNNSCNVSTNGDGDGGTKENKLSRKLYNWDKDLRALAYIGKGNIEISEPERKSKPKKPKRKASPTNKSTSKSQHQSQKTKDKIKVEPKVQSRKSKNKTQEVRDKNVDELQDKAVSVVKPTINIISRKKWAEPVETERSQNKSNNNEENINTNKIDTPELERISLQNEIGAKLNISDLLETPYKQALYDIQMETPKFLGPDIPGDPLSDVKIMNIPTPRFLNTPKLPQNTPSSYSSRPTDYSSGGSYYKPDDQDYVLANEIMEDALSASAGSLKTNKEAAEIVNTEKVLEGKSRPVRQCTKNVSYNYGTPSCSKIKDVEEKTEKCSTCSDTSNKTDRKKDKLKISVTDKDNVVEKKREPKKKSKKYKSPKKKEAPRTFLKIKPRRTTPVKETLGKGKKKTSDLSHIVCMKPLAKKIAGKERSVCFSPISVSPVPTRSRRKSSTPRKLHKRFNLESSKISSPDRKKQISQCNVVQITNLNSFSTQESDNEQQPLRWTDDGSQECNTVEQPVNESDDITKIKEYIKTTVPNEVRSNNEGEGTLQVDLIKRGFDVETARMIERDLLETLTTTANLKTSIPSISQSIPSLICCEKKNESAASKQSDKSTESDCSTSNNLQIVRGDDDNDELDFSVYECNEDTNNYVVYKYDEAQFIPSEQVKLKDKFSMEICVEDDVEIRLRATHFNTVFEHDSKQEDMVNCDEKVIEKQVSQHHHNNLCTPRKAQCYEIFDSTLASLDTPLKSNGSKAQEFETVTEIVLEVEKLETDIKLKPESKKRRRVQSGASDESSNGSKKVKPDTSYLLNSAGIQNIDIESVLSKLHGP